MADATGARQHTLEKIVGQLGSGFNEERMHSAMLLAYASSIYSVLRKDCVVSPLYRLIYDEKNNNISMREKIGSGLPPEDNALDISTEDEIFCANVREIPLLMEGETGVGKTHAAMRYLSVILDKSEFFSYRLSANAFVNNLFSHFQEGKMVNGMPVISARTDLIEKCAAGLTDEINRGDSNETLQLFDNEMHLGGTIYKLGIPVPDISKGIYDPKSGRLKRLLILCAQNPANSDDTKFTQTMQLDAAVDNRLLKTYVGNAAASAGSTLWLSEGSKRPHDEFLEKFSARAAKLLGVDASAFSDLKDDWIPTYAWITESARTDKPILYSAMELSDLMIATFSGNLIKYFDYEKQVIKIWNDRLKTGVEISSDLQETDNVKKIHEVTHSFKVPIIFRDIVQMKKIADVLATLKNIKDSLMSPDPVKSYMDTKRYVTVREVAGAASLLARNKQTGNALSPMNAINAVLTQYVSLTEDYIKDQKYLSASFNLLDPNLGIKKIAIYKALRDTIHNSESVDYLIARISDQAKYLTGKISVSDDIKNVMIARSVGDLMTLCGFLSQYKAEVGSIFSKYDIKTRIPKAFNDLGKLYYEKLDENAMVFPEVYQHRIQRTLGL